MALALLIAKAECDYERPTFAGIPAAGLANFCWVNGQFGSTTERRTP
jgi:hypothetical protein